MKKLKVSIITVNYKGREYLEKFFASLEKLDYSNWELIFVDNNSQDGSVDYVKKNQPRVKVIAHEKNLGYVLANNQAAQKAQGKYLFFLNDDTRVDPNLLSVLVSQMEKDPRLGIAGCRMKDYQGKRTLHTGIGVDFWGYPVVKDKIFYIEGSALMIRKSLFDQLKGFDWQYFMFHEDVDLAWRVWLLGYQVRAFSQAIVNHAVGASAGGGPKVKGRYHSSFLRRYYSERNNIRSLLKNYHWLTLIFALPVYFGISLTELVFYLFLLQPRIIYLYSKAYFWNLVNLSDTLKERQLVQKSRQVSDLKILKQMYFGLGKLVALRKAGLPRFS